MNEIAPVMVVQLLLLLLLLLLFDLVPAYFVMCVVVAVCVAIPCQWHIVLDVPMDAAAVVAVVDWNVVVHVWQYYSYVSRLSYRQWDGWWMILLHRILLPTML